MSGLLATTLIPNSLNLQGTTYSIRTVILFPVLAMISAIGISDLVALFKNKYWRIGAAFLVSLLYLLFVGNFIFQYFGRLPVDRNEGWFLPQRTAFHYSTLMNKISPSTKINIISQEAKPDFYRYLLFSAAYTDTNSIKQINQKIEQGKYSAQNLTISGSCPKQFDLQQVYLIDSRIDCSGSDSTNEIASIKDAGTKFKIVNDHLCKNLVSQRYPHIKNISLLNIEALPLETFCKEFVTNTRLPSL